MIMNFRKASGKACGLPHPTKSSSSSLHTQALCSRLLLSGFIYSIWKEFIGHFFDQVPLLPTSQPPHPNKKKGLLPKNETN
jgi:hypothetical protein